MSIRKNFIPAFAFGLIVLASAAVTSGQTAPPEPDRQFSLYGMHFINGGQSVRVAVQNPRVSDGEIVPCIKVRVVFDVYEAVGDGSVRLRFVRRVLREVELDPGDAATFDFAAHRNGDWVSPTVFAEPEEGEIGPVRLLPTVTVRQLGFTVFNLPAVLKGFDPQPDPPASRPERVSSLGPRKGEKE